MKNKFMAILSVTVFSLSLVIGQISSSAYSLADNFTPATYTANLVTSAVAKGTVSEYLVLENDYALFLDKQKSVLKQGTVYTNSNSYTWYSTLTNKTGATVEKVTGLGCVSFAYNLSDLVFGKNTTTAQKKFRVARNYTNYTKIKVGDIVRLYGDTHSVVVIKIDRVAKNIVVAEGNYNKKINWGRTISFDKLKNYPITYAHTRYQSAFDNVTTIPTLSSTVK